MTTTRNKFVTASVIGISLMLVIIMAMDWSRLFTGVTDEYPVSRTLKLILSFMTMVLAWGAGSDALDGRDRIMLRIAFVAVFVSDIAFRIDQGLIGAGIFTVVQILLIVRHLGGIGEFIKGPLFPKYRLRLLGLVLGVALADTVLILTVFRPIMGSNPIFIPIICYSVFLCTSLCAGVTSLAIGRFPRRNAVCIATGSAGLFICDLTVGLNMGLPHETLYIVTTSITWMFYAPALVLIGLSGFRMKASF